MVCSLGGAQMATVLDGGSTSQIMTEEVDCWKLAAQYIHRELREADEANLLDEEDMHVFGLRPMMDPLILVCCNSCKKPVMDSQYAVHVEICKLLSSVVDGTPDLDVGGGQKKPPRKERKQSQNNNCTEVVSVGETEMFTTTVDKIDASKSGLDEQIITKNSFSVDAKGMLRVPAPLASKIFYSQRNHRLRSSLSRMYYESSAAQHDHGLVNVQQSERNNTTSSWNQAPKSFRNEKTEEQYEKIDTHVLHMMKNPDQISAQSSEVNLDESQTCQPMSSSNPSTVNNALGPQRTPAENLTSSFRPDPYVFAGN